MSWDRHCPFSLSGESDASHPWGLHGVDLSHSHHRPHCGRLTLPAGTVPSARHPASKRRDLGAHVWAPPKGGLHEGQAPSGGGAIGTAAGAQSPLQIVRHFACLHAPRETGSEPQGAGTGLPLTRTSWFPCSCLWRPWQFVGQQSRKWSQLLKRLRASFPSHPYSYSIVTPPFTPPEACSWFCFPLGSVPTSFPTSLH